MKVDFNFTPSKFKSSRELFTKPDSYELKFPNEEPMGLLETNDGKVAFVEFTYEDEGLNDESLIGPHYTGPGIYFLDLSKNDDKGDNIPFWVVLPKSKTLTVAGTKAIFEKIKDILLNDEYKLSTFWAFDA